jgi:hypothetical protein
MNYFNKMLLLSLALMLASTNMFGMARAKSSVDALITQVNALTRDLKEFKKCRKSAQGCPPELTQRLKTAGVNVAKGTAVVVGTAVVATAAVYGSKRLASTPKALVARAIRHVGLKESDLNNFEKEILMATAMQDTNADVFSKTKNHTAAVSNMKNSDQVIKAMEWINARTNNKVLTQMTAALKQELPSSIPLPVVADGEEL